MSEQVEISHKPRVNRYVVKVIAVMDIPVSRRISTYIAATNNQPGRYDYGERYEDVEKKEETIYEQSVEYLDISSLVSVVNNLEDL